MCNDLAHLIECIWAFSFSPINPCETGWFSSKFPLPMNIIQLCKWWAKGNERLSVLVIQLVSAQLCWWKNTSTICYSPMWGISNSKSVAKPGQLGDQLDTSPSYLSLQNANAKTGDMCRKNTGCISRICYNSFGRMNGTDSLPRKPWCWPESYKNNAHQLAYHVKVNEHVFSSGWDTIYPVPEIDL